MPRPENNRIVFTPPLFAEFKPTFVKGNELESLFLTIDEFEAIRLADHAGLSHLEAAREMFISRPTFSRLISKARRKMADFIVLGRVLTIEGGNIHFKNNIVQCENCGYSIVSNIGDVPEFCPECNSTQLRSLAGGFGHGNCCISNNHKKGGRNAKRKQNRARRNGPNDR